MTVTKPWWVYFLECRGGSIYIGISNDVEARFEKHAAGRGARYTRMYPPIRVLARQRYPSRSEAARAEHELKRLTAGERRRWVATLAAFD